MKNREHLNSLTNEELAEKLCDFVNDIADRADIDDMCKLCPVKKQCRRGHNGFAAWLSQEAKEDAKTFLITYREVLKHRTIKIEAFSKYDAKQRFYRRYPKYEIIKIEEVEE